VGFYRSQPQAIFEICSRPCAAAKGEGEMMIREETLSRQQERTAAESAGATY
jgi:hypothetical protein